MTKPTDLRPVRDCLSAMIGKREAELAGIARQMHDLNLEYEAHCNAGSTPVFALRAYEDRTRAIRLRQLSDRLARLDTTRGLLARDLAQLRCKNDLIATWDAKAKRRAAQQRARRLDQS